ncbi:MAG: hypothetical protein WB815_10855 [Nitrososphaeraceae archaeon]
MVQLTLLIFASIAVIFTTTQTEAASTTIADLNSMQVTPSPTPTPTPPIPFSAATPATTTTTTILYTTLMTQELSSVDSVLLVSVLEKILENLEKNL